MSEEVVTEFVAAYTREYDYYQAAARLCSQRCEALLGPRGVRAIVTYRAKRPIKLLTKLRERDQKQSYASSQQIRDDIADLAGVRIALYFPGDRESVGSILKENFLIDLERNFPKSAELKRQGKRFDGYRADHYRVYIHDGSLDHAQKQYATAKIEIQVGSVLMHAWAEVEHDLMYKPESGDLSEDEEAILDEVNGLVLTGEVALERLQRALQRRLAENDAPFDSHYDLAAYLHRWLQGAKPRSDLQLGRVDLMWELLREAKLNSATKLKEQVGEPDSLSTDEPISDQIADIILGKRPELYSFYSNLQARLTFTSIYDQTQPMAAHRSQAIGRFLSAWIILERTHALNDKSPSYRSRDIVGWAQRIELSQKALETIRNVRQVRNQLVHGIEIPDRGFLDEATLQLRRVLSELENHRDESVRQAYREAQLP
ncbi:MAG: RelA/SpoT domain-containing protein [Methylocella sp.]